MCVHCARSQPLMFFGGQARAKSPFAARSSHLDWLVHRRTHSIWASMLTIAVNAEAARIGGGRTSLRALLAAKHTSDEFKFAPMFRSHSTGKAQGSEDVSDGEPDRPLTIAERIRWERSEVPRALRQVRSGVLLQPSNMPMLRNLLLPQVQILHNVAPLVRLSPLVSGKVLARLMILRRFTVYSVRSNHGMIFLSGVGLHLAQGHGLRGKSIVIRPGVDAVPVQPMSNRDKIVIVVAHLFRYKRIEDAITAFSASGLGKRGWQLQIYGAPFDRPYYRLIARLVEESGPSVRFFGNRPAAEVRAAIGRARVMLQCSAIENAPQVVFEALAAQTPVVASDIGAHSELLCRGLYPLGDVFALSKELKAAAEGLLREQARVPLRPWSEFADAVGRFCCEVATDGPGAG